MNYSEFKELWKSEERRTFQGWDFSYIQGRTWDEDLPWNYDSIVRQYLKEDFILLDMGTGGGEYLLTLQHPYHNTLATEAYVPNLELCKKVLSPLGIDVRQVFEDSCLPFESSMFDIIINRHEAFDVDEVYRLLKPKGLFITQQVGGLNNKELSRFLIKDFKEITGNGHNLKNNEALLRSKDFDILMAEECFPKKRFFDVGALVYLAKIIEWEFPGFSVDSCFEKLCELHKEVEKVGFIEGKEHRFIIAAQKPDSGI